jgi:lipase chaperone LimK
MHSFTLSPNLLLDHFSLLMGEGCTPSDVQEIVSIYIDGTLPESARPDAIDLSTRYIDYRQAISELPNQCACPFGKYQWANRSAR